MSTIAGSGVVRDAFGPATWDSLEPDTAVHSSRWIATMLSRLPGRALMAVHQGQAGPLGFTGAVVDDPEAYEAYNPWTILRCPQPVFTEVHAAGRPAPDVGDAASDILPSAVLVAPGYHGDPAGPGRAHPPDVHAALASICDWAWSSGLATVAVLYTTPASKETVEPAVAALGGSSFDLTSRWVRAVTWADPAGFRHDLSRRRRAEVHRQLHRLDELGCSVEAAEPATCFGDVIEARCDLLHHYGQPVDVAGEERRLRTLIDVFGTGLRLWVTRRAGRLVACGLFLAYRRTLLNVWVGTTAAGRATPYAHLAATYHGPMLDVSDAEFDVIDYGIGHGDTKRLQGCSGMPLRGHLVPRPGRTGD